MGHGVSWQRLIVCCVDNRIAQTSRCDAANRKWRDWRPGPASFAAAPMDCAEPGEMSAKP